MLDIHHDSNNQCHNTMHQIANFSHYIQNNKNTSKHIKYVLHNKIKITQTNNR